MKPSTLCISSTNNNSVRLFDTLFVGKRYKFAFTHKISCIGVVCEVDKNKQTFVVYDSVTNDYELIPMKRLLRCESIK